MKPKLFKTQHIRNFKCDWLCTTIPYHFNIGQFMVKKVRLSSTVACLYNVFLKHLLSETNQLFYHLSYQNATTSSPHFSRLYFPIDKNENYFHLRFKIILLTKKIFMYTILQFSHTILAKVGISSCYAKALCYNTQPCTSNKFFPS